MCGYCYFTAMETVWVSVSLCWSWRHVDKPRTCCTDAVWFTEPLKFCLEEYSLSPEPCLSSSIVNTEADFVALSRQTSIKILCRQRFTTSLGSLSHCCPVLLMKKSFLMSTLNLQSCDLWPLHAFISSAVY